MKILAREQQPGESPPMPLVGSSPTFTFTILRVPPSVPASEFVKQLNAALAP